MSSSTSRPCVAIIAAGAMGAPMGARLASSGCRVLTDLTNRSASTRKRAEQAGMEDASLAQIASTADFVLSVLPPSDALQLAQDFRSHIAPEDGRSFIYADCNAVSPTTVKKVQSIFDGTHVRFLDAGIIGGPPREGYDPTIYASADDPSVLSAFEGLNELGLKIVALRGEGAGIGDASALKMSYAGIAKGTIALFTTMILAAHASSPATAQALLEELSSSRPDYLARIAGHIPSMLPKAYRWSGEMEEIAEFVGGEEGSTYNGIANLYRRIEKAVNGQEGRSGDVEVLQNFVERAKKELEDGQKKKE